MLRETLMGAPIHDLNTCLAILMLRAADCNQDEVASYLGHGKPLIVKVEKWFKQLSYEDAISVCYDQSINNALWIEIVNIDQELGKDTLVVLGKMNSNYVLMHYAKIKRKEQKQPLLIPRSQQHYSRLTDAAEKLRQNIKQIKGTKGDLTDNITQGYIQFSKARERKQSLQNVDRLDAECLLSHIVVMYPEFRAIESWEKLTTRKSVAGISNDMLRKLKKISHGIALEGTCEICRSWYPDKRNPTPAIEERQEMDCVPSDR